MNNLCGRERCEVLAEYVIENRATVRNTAVYFGISKSTVHKDVSVKLKYINPILYTNVKEILDINKSERHLRGGEATRLRYLKNKK
ncbi:MAG: stage III sporulation protein D [Ruminococcaceae bacterium]|nr:stage III sporulation protein D [Oscillospiraceae bacterium]